MSIPLANTSVAIRNLKSLFLNFFKIFSLSSWEQALAMLKNVYNINTIEHKSI